MLFSFISITILFSNIEYSISETTCKQKSMILFRGHYSNIIVLNKSLISTRKTNTISGSNQCLMNCNFYPLSLTNTYCSINGYITLDLIQQYYINTIIIWLYDGDSREFNFVIYAVQKNKKKQLIYESANATSIIKLKFQDSQPIQIQFWNRNGNTLNQNLNLYKIIAYYRF